MVPTTSLPPIPGEVIDPPPKDAPDTIKELDRRDGALSSGVGVAYRAFARFRQSQASLLAAGTAYYLFLALFAVIAVAYGLAAAIGSDSVGEYLTDALGEAFPGLLGDDGVDPGRLQRVGQALSLVGVVGLLYGGTGAVIAAMRAVHRVYGAPQDARSVVVARLRALLWLAVLGLLILASYAMSSITADLSGELRSAVGIDLGSPVLLRIVAVTLALIANFAVVYLVLGHFGGIRPERRARVIGAAVGAVVTEVLKTVMALLIHFTVDKPQYGAVAAPIGVLFVLYLQSLTLYGSAALTAGVADRDVPLEAIEEADVEEAQTAVEESSGKAAEPAASGRVGSDGT